MVVLHAVQDWTLALREGWLPFFVGLAHRDECDACFSALFLAKNTAVVGRLPPVEATQCRCVLARVTFHNSTIFTVLYP